MKQTNYNYIYESQQNMIYPIYKDKKICTKISERLGYDLDKIVNKELNQVTIIHTLGKYDFDTITFIGMGSKESMTTSKMRKAFATVSKTVKSASGFVTKAGQTEKIDVHLVARLFVETYLLTSYQEQVIGHDKKEMIPVDLMASDVDLMEDIRIAEIYAKGINHAREYADTPSNIMTPIRMVEIAQSLAKQYQMECTILDKNELEQMGAGGILSVNQGSHIPAYMICLKYSNGGDQPYSAIIGKGLTFDSGGYTLKPNSYGMKYDMCGGADVLGIMEILAATHVQANVYGIIPTTENLVSDRAYKPQDVITTLSKKTVEIVSTDAEGRLILCDAITYAQQLGATRIIDIATLTGACVAALGDVYTGVFSNSDDYYKEFEESMKRSDEKGWRLPVDEEYFHKISSSSADFKNSMGKPGGGASIAANFLQAFVEENVEWIHLDVAGTADQDGKGATGAMIRSVVNLYNR